MAVEVRLLTSAATSSKLSQPKASLKNHLGDCHKEENYADDGVQAEEGQINPIETSSPSNPVLQNEATNNDEPADQVSDTKSAKKSEGKQ